jgi:phenylpropionate dioxygenase-like ring-hydroxylating dioxygenase large terminal subunit
MSSQEKDTKSTRDLRGYWYPISFSKDLVVGDNPVGLHILGDPIVLYRDPVSLSAVCLADICPHRSAPLSIGQVVDGKLECKYHGWQFDTEGKVVKIPALLPDKSIPSTAKTRKYPTVERYRLVWVWPGPPELADDTKIPDVRVGKGINATEGFPEVPGIEKTFDLDCDHTLMVENLLDPAHLPFTHVGTISSRSQMRPIRAETNVLENEGISTIFHMLHANGDLKSKVYSQFYPPCHVEVNAIFVESKGWGMHQRMHCIPTRPGHMRLIYYMARNVLAWLDRMPLVSSFNDRLVEKIVFQDYELLHGQTIRLKQGANPWNNPIQVDLPPKKYRQWINAALKESALKTWFTGYSADIEDLVTAKAKSNNSCLLYSSACDLYSAADEAHVFPKQRNVNNLCYTDPQKIEYIVNGKKSSSSSTPSWWRTPLIIAVFGITMWYASANGFAKNINLSAISF